jgi:hypothetical protein
VNRQDVDQFDLAHAMLSDALGFSVLNTALLVTMRYNDLPEDSCLRYWLDSLSITEIPLDYQIATGLSIIGALLKRSVYVDQVRWRVYPNLSVLLIGPSGVGKDSAINPAAKFIHEINPNLTLKGDTIEYVKDELVKLDDPAAAYIPANELTAFLGGKDYQKGIAASLTDLLSTGDQILLGTKKDGTRVIRRPTITMHAGSTADWLENLPEDGLAGGFLPRFLIIYADFPERHVAWVKYDNLSPEKIKAEKGLVEFEKSVRYIIKTWGGVQLQKKEHEIVPTTGAEEFYRNWYHNRFKYFCKPVHAYANRSRDIVHKIAIIMALSRGHCYTEEADYAFAAKLMVSVGGNLEKVIVPMLGRKRKKY